VQKLNPDDLYSKRPVRPDWKKLRPYDEAVIDKFLSDKHC
jgi:inositol oxygenase